MPSRPRTYAGKPAGVRRAERRARLVVATREILGEVGWTRTSIRAVCGRAGLADRYFYESFADRDALLAGVFDEVASESVAAVAAAVAGVAIGPAAARDRARAAVNAFLDLIQDQAGVARVALFDTPDSPVVQRHRRAALRRFVAFLVAQADAIGPHTGVSALDRELTAHALIGALQELLVAREQGELDVSRERLAEHAAALAQVALGVTSA